MMHLHLLPLIVTVVLSVVVGFWIWRTRRDVRGVRLYLLLILVGGILWQLQLIAHILTNNWGVARILTVSEKFTGYTASFLWILFVAEFTNSEFHRNRWVKVLFGAVIVGYLLLAVTNSAHLLLFTDIKKISEPFMHASVVRGSVYFVFLGITYAFVVTGVYVLIRFISRTRQSAHLPIVLLLAGAVGVAVANLSSIAGLGPVATFQYGGYGAVPFIIATSVGVFRLGLFDLAPVARTTLVESLNDAVIVVDEAGRIVDFNRKAVSLWPTLPENEGRQLEAACPELAPKVDISGAESRTTQITLEVDGQTRHFSMLVSPVETPFDGTGTLGYSILLRDVTELERSRQELERHNKRLDQVAASISHDLRNPLTVAEGHLSLLEAGLDDPDLAPHVESMADAHVRMRDIIDDVLTLAREGAVVEDWQSVGIAAVSREAWEHVETANATLEVAGDATVMADRSRLLTVFENLFRNAVEHGSTSPQTASADAVEHGSTSNQTGADDAPEHGTPDDGSSVTITVEILADGFAVTDDGPGIPEDIRDDVFEIGYSTETAGTGYGLHIVEQIAAAHGWSITVTDGHDGGARFEITDVDWAE